MKSVKFDKSEEKKPLRFPCLMRGKDSGNIALVKMSFLVIVHSDVAPKFIGTIIYKHNEDWLSRYDLYTGTIQLSNE